MKVVILAGGLGTRLSEETKSIPKPMVRIGDFPIIWHIMKYYSHFNFNDFIICLGYKGNKLKEFFLNYSMYMCDVKINTKHGSVETTNRISEDWNIELVETGLETMTGGRLKRIRHILGDEDFLMTYGDGLSNVDINELITFHKSNKRKATITSVVPPSRFGSLKINNNVVESFKEKPIGKNGRINGGYFVLSPKVIDYIDDDQTVWEKGPLENIAKDNELMAFQHDGFWQPMDTLRDKELLEKLWLNNNAPWKNW